MKDSKVKQVPSGVGSSGVEGKTERVKEEDYSGHTLFCVWKYNKEGEMNEKDGVDISN